jgi:hypothetical protein
MKVWFVFNKFRLEFLHIPVMENRDSAVGIATGYGLDVQGVGVRVPVWQKFSLKM